MEELENQRAELVDKLVIKIIKEVTEGDVRNFIVNNGRGGCLYKKFLACNRKDYNGKGGAIVNTRWIEKMVSVHEMSRCEDNQKVKYIGGYLLVRHSHGGTPRSRLEICGMVAATEPTTILSVVLKVRVLTDEAIRNGSLMKNTKKKGNGGDLSMDRNVKDYNKRSRTGRAFATITNLVRKEYTVTAPKFTNCNFHHLVNSDSCSCLMLNRAPRQGGSRPNQAMAIEGGQGRGNNGNRYVEEHS
nr:reverse transcriptase domain-containing protein [Tanacetum cinerariifolium]